jgi:Ca-activated chloride channel family protein
MRRIRIIKRPSERRAAMLVLIAVCLPLCIIMAGFAINVAWMQLVRTELRTATDAAARAGAKQLSVTQTTAAARTAAKNAAKRNLVAGCPLQLADNDIEFGKSVQPSPLSRFAFTPDANKPNAVRVTGRRTQASLDGPANQVFTGLLNTRQFEPSKVAIGTQLDRDICLVVDRSGSMMRGLFGSDVPGGKCKPPHPTKSRWGNLATAVRSFLDELEKTSQDELCGMVSYSSDITSCGQKFKISEINCDLTKDYKLIRDAMGKKSAGPVEGNTAISAGLDDGITVLTGAAARPFAVKTMILMTDGIHNTGAEPIRSARVAAQKGIVIHTITFSVEADVPRMKDVAAATGGQHFHADDQAELIKVFRQIASTLPVLLTE